MNRQLRVAVIGAGPAGIYASDILTKSDVDVRVDIIERNPTPFGLIRYGVAPDHPRIKEIIKALRRVLSQDDIRFFGNVNYGTDLKLDDLQQFYDAVIFATGANKDRPIQIPGIDLRGSYGAADFVSWYDGHPDVHTEWPLEAESVAVLGAGNVALDVARMLAKTADELLVTEIPDNVYHGIKANRAQDCGLKTRGRVELALHDDGRVGAAGPEEQLVGVGGLARRCGQDPAVVGEVVRVLGHVVDERVVGKGAVLHAGQEGQLVNRLANGGDRLPGVLRERHQWLQIWWKW